MLGLSSKEVLDNSFTAGTAVLLKSQHIIEVLENITEKMLKHIASVFSFCFNDVQIVPFDKENASIPFITAIHSALTCILQAVAFKIMLHFLYFTLSQIISLWHLQNKNILYFQSEAIQLHHNRLGRHY